MSQILKIEPLLKKLDIKDSKFMEMALFASVVFSEEEMQLSSVKAVDNFYPLIGSLELRNAQGVYSMKSNPAPELSGLRVSPKLIENKIWG